MNLMENGGCVEHEAGRHLDKIGYKQVYVEIGKASMYKHIGGKGYKHNISALNLYIDLSSG